MTDSENWHRFSGWAAACGIDPMELASPRFLDLVQHFFALTADYTLAEQIKFNRELTGISTGSYSRRVDDRGIEMPDWWIDDDTTASSAAQTLLEMKGWRG